MEAIILAGGMGTRLQSVISDVPKPMAPIKGKPFLCYILDALIHHGFTDVILSVGHKQETIIDYFGGKYDILNIQYSKENVPLGTGGAIRQALNLVSHSNVFVLNGDTFFSVDYNQIIQAHDHADALLTISLKEMHNFDRYGTIVTLDNKVVSFKEKQFTLKGYINAGIYVVDKNLFDSLELPEKFSFEIDFMQRYYNKLNFNTCISKGYFIDIGIPEDYFKAQKELKVFYDE
jgi:D-glycero-alpha-D-manno-heptose 1-phosphate guanylyltransferase